MTGTIGSFAVTLGFVVSLAGVLTMARGLRAGSGRLLRRSRHLAPALLGCALLAAGAMEVALLRHDFSLRYVAQNGSRSTPVLYTVASLWGALEGLILLWGLILSGYLVLMVRHFRRRLSDPMLGWATLVMFATAAFFFALMLGPANPFRTVIGPLPLDGPGPNPLFQNHPLMAFHPPMLYLGYVGFAVPFAFAIAALATGRVGEGWLVETRRGTLFAWGFLSVGIVLGAWWSYEVLGWGGFWAWDPAESAAFLPWLTATAYLHSVMVQERRGVLRVWNLSLVVATFCLTILGAFLTRSGVLESVRAFTASAIGPALLGFLAVAAGVSVVLIGVRADRLRSPGRMESPVSREGAFLANNVLFAGFAFMVLLGTVFPQLLEAFSGERIAVGRPHLDRMAVPFGLALVFLMAVAPALPWRRATGEVLHQRLLGPALAATATVVVALALGARSLAPLLAFGLGAFAAATALRTLWLGVRHSGVSALTGRTGGGMIVHLGVVLVAVALAASGSYGRAAEFRLRPGESAQLAGHRVTFLGVATRQTEDKKVLKARVRIDDGPVYAPALTQFAFGARTIATPSVRTGLTGDVHLTLVEGTSRPGEPVTIVVTVQPLVAWLWGGGALIGLGTLLAAWPRRRRGLPGMAPSETSEVTVGLAGRGIPVLNRPTEGGRRLSKSKVEGRAEA